MTYQPKWRNGGPVVAGERDCADRYQVIRKVLDRVAGEHRGGPFTIMDVGANLGYFTSRAVADYRCRATAVDPLPALARIASDRIRVVQRRVDTAALRNMARHDVVLALSVLHHMPDWRQAIHQLRACRQWAIVEVPHPDEKWMRSAVARHQLRQIHDVVAGLAVTRLGDFERTGRDGSRHMRPMFLLPGTVQTMAGSVFGGSKSCSKNLPLYGTGLDKLLGYKPYPGSLNLRLDREPTWGIPGVDFVGRYKRKSRDYQFWQAWIGKVACHAMRPGRRGHGPDCVEIVAGTRLRDRLAVTDSMPVTVDVVVTDQVLKLVSGKTGYRMWDLPGKISSCMKAGHAYEQPLLAHIRARKFSGVAVDAGANIGNHTLWLAAMCGLKVTAFEPIKHTELARNIALNRLGHRVDVFPTALGAKPGFARTVGKGRLATGRGTLPVRRLDDYHLTNVALIKADVEGMEADVLAGGEKTIRRDRPVIYAETWDAGQHRQVAAVIEPWGYRKTGQFTSKESPTPVEQWEWRA